MHTILAARTDFSVGESILSAADIVKQAKALGQSVVGITDTMSVTGMISFTNQAKKAGVRPVIGTRLRLTDNPTWRPAKGEKKKHMPKEYYLTAYALTSEGIKALFRLLTKGNSEDRFYYVSKLGFEDLYGELKGLSAGDVAICLGEDSSVLTHPEYKEIARKIGSLCEDTYAPFVAIHTPYYGLINCRSAEVINEVGSRIKPLTIRPGLYLEGEADTQEIMTAISSGAKISDGWFRSRFNRDLDLVSLARMIPEVKSCAEHMSRRTGTSLADCIAYFKDGLEQTKTLADLVSYEWKKADVSLPKMAENEYEALAKECSAGWKSRFSGDVFGHRPTQADLASKYLPRLKYELSILKRLNFSGYFLLVQDIVRFSKSNGILVGPGRGSVGGSLVAYLMGITDCDPIRFNLLFERFINPDRLDLPDADLDFMSTRRHEVIEYLVDKYGPEYVAGVSNFGTLAAASSIRDVGKVLGISEREYSISKMVPKNHGSNVPLPECRKEVAEIEEFASNHPVAWSIMEKLEGTIRNFSQHAAGIVIGGEPLVNRAVLEKRKEDQVVCWDKKIVEDQGLVKVDILGLAALDIMASALRYIKERHGKTIDLNSIPLTDPLVLKNFAEARTTGIFQFESGGMRKLLKELGADGSITFEDITAATALYRPGPMESGMMESFYKRKQGQEPIEYDHPLMESVLETTFGVIVYQEQVMNISRVIAGYSGADADKLRKIMGKKQPEAMAAERDKFVQGAIETIDCDEKWAGALFDKIEGFAGYGFNLSHSVEYTLISYQCMWLKVNFPVEFYAATLTTMSEEKLPGLIKDALENGVHVDTPDINNSTNRFEIVTDTRLVMPFQKAKGISEKTAAAIMEARESGPFEDKANFLTRVEKRRCNARHQEVLDRIGAFARIEPGQLPSNHPDRIAGQIELLPGLISAHVPIDRDMHRDKGARAAIDEIVSSYRASKDTDGLPVKPVFGRNARFMIISDGPGNEEDVAGLMGVSRSNNAVIEAILNAGLDVSDYYWTGLIKRPKKGRMISPDEIKMFAPYLDREIRALEPPVIVLMGSTTTRNFISDFKGKASDQAGKVIYNPHLNANLVVAFSPGEIYHDPEKQNNMNTVFTTVAELLA